MKNEGNRYTIFRHACNLARRRIPRDEIEGICHVFADKCDPPLHDDEVRRIVASVTGHYPPSLIMEPNHVRDS